MMIWLMCWTTSFEEAELWPGSPKNCDFVFILLLSISVFICYLILIDLDFMLLLPVFVISL